MSKLPHILGFVRLENKDATKNHHKFYEMTFKQITGDMWDVEVRYGRIGTPGKVLSLRGAASTYMPDTEQAFLDQMKSKFKDKEYELIDLGVSDKSLKSRIEDLQSLFEGSTRIFDKLELRDF